MRTRILLAALAITTMALPTAALGAARTSGAHRTYALGHAKRCKLGFIKRTERHDVNGKSIRYIACVYVASRVLPPAATAPTTTAPVVTPTTQVVPTPTTVPTRVAANLDPTISQDPTNPLAVTFSFWATATSGSLPDGTLTLTVDVHNVASVSATCLVNIGPDYGAAGTSSNTPATCTRTLPGFGRYDLSTVYSGGGGVSAVSQTETDTISPFAATITTGTATNSTPDVDSDNNYETTISLPVTVSGQQVSPTGTITATGWTCSTLVGGASTCTQTVEQPTSGTTSLTAALSYSGDSNYSSATASGSATVPTAPAPQQVDVATTTQCVAGSPAPKCTFLSNNDNTINGAAEVLVNGLAIHTGTITFTDATNAVLCVATLTDQVGIARCNAPYSGGSIVQTPVTAAYSGATVNVGDAYIDVYQTSSEVAIHS